MHIQLYPFRAMACPCEIRLATPDAAAGRTLAEAAIAEVGRVEQKYSRYRSDSIVGEINAAAGTTRWVNCDEETVWLLDYADRLHQMSDGLFDITSGVLRRVWNFRVPRLPEAEALGEVLELIGWQRVERRGPAVRLPRAGMEIDFGGFGKEYAADRAAALLMQAGVRHGYVNLGGDIRVIGPQLDGQPWRVGVQDPRQEGQVVAHVGLTAGALATSGDYEKFFELDGRRYCHVLNPRSGMPVGHWRSVSVQAPLALAAGSCTTIAMLKEEAAIDFLNSTGFVYLAIDQAGNIHKRDPQDGSA